MSLRRYCSLAVALGVVIASEPVGAVSAPRAVVPFGAAELFQSDEATGLALGGFDAITYFLPGGPKPGREVFEVIWGGVAWRFASEANREAFARDPASFAPQIGGYDAEAASRGRLVDADPLLFIVRDGRLYLFRNDANRARFLSDESLEERSHRGWLALQGSLVRP